MLRIIIPRWKSSDKSGTPPDRQSAGESLFSTKLDQIAPRNIIFPIPKIFENFAPQIPEDISEAQNQTPKLRKRCPQQNFGLQIPEKGGVRKKHAKTGTSEGVRKNKVEKRIRSE